MNAVPKVVVFDLGKVLVDFDYGIIAGKLAAQGKIDPLLAKKFLDHAPLLFRFETGMMTPEEFFAEVKAGTGFRGDFEEFKRIFVEIFTPMAPMLELQAALRSKGVPMYIFSNTNELQLGHIRRSYPFFSNFDGYVLSYEHGAMKPQARLYEVVEEITKRRGNEILYLDDRPENIAAGAARGWQVILQETPEKSWAGVKKAGLLD